MKLKDILKQKNLNEGHVVDEMDDKWDEFKRTISKLERLLIDKGVPVKEVNKVGIDFNNKVLKPYAKLMDEIIKKYKL